MMLDFVITFEELNAIFKAKNIDFNNYDKGRLMHEATGAGRGYAVAGGVISAIEQCIEEYYPGTEVQTETLWRVLQIVRRCFFLQSRKERWLYD